MTVAIIDGDVLAYMACESRYKNGQGYTIYQLEEKVFTPEEDAAYLTKSWLRFQEIVKDLCECCFTDQFKMAVKGEGNFRNDIYPEYKANRHADPTKRNPFVPQLRQMAVDTGIATAAHGMEADDLLRIWQQECVKNGEDYVICSIDKDLRCIPGRHYVMNKNDFITMEEHESIRFYYEQLLKGDPTDNIKGIPKVGEVRARKYLEQYGTEAEFQYVVTEAYQGAFGNDWHDELMLNGRLLYLKKSFDDEFTMDGWNTCSYEEQETVEKIVLIECEKPNLSAVELVEKFNELANLITNVTIPETPQVHAGQGTPTEIPVWNPAWSKGKRG